MQKQLRFLIIAAFIVVTTKSFSQDFTFNPTEGCNPVTVSFTNNVPPQIANYFIWNYGDGSDLDTVFNGLHTYTIDGSYSPSVDGYDTIGGGMVYVNTYLANDPITVYSNPAIFSIFPKDSVCPGEQLGFSLINNQPPLNDIRWIFGDGSVDSNNIPSTSHSYSSLGNYIVQCIFSSECGTDTISDTIHIVNTIPPAVSFTFNDAGVCPGEGIYFFPSQNLISYLWQFGDGNTSTSATPYNPYSQYGLYSVTLTASNSCGASASYIDTVSIANSPMANFNVAAYPNISCPNDPIDFNTDHTSLTTIYKWYFGDGDSSSLRAPSHAYSNYGTYTATLVLTNLCGNSGVRTVSVSVVPGGGINNIFIANNLDSVCPGGSIVFDTQSSSQYLWDFGDGNTDTSKIVQHTYSALGEYTVSITLTNGCGVDSTEYKVVKVVDDIFPVLFGNEFGVTSNSSCQGDSIVFFALGGDHYSWHFGDGTSATSTFPYNTPNGLADGVKHAYSANGTYTVTLEFFNGCGNSVLDSSIVIDVNGSNPVYGGLFPPQNPFESCAPVSITAYGGSSYSWDYGDGSTDSTTSSTVYHQYDTAGVYYVSVTIYNSCGNNNTYSDSVIVTPIQIPTASLVSDTFYASSASMYQWYLNNNMIIGATDSSYIPNTSGKYSVVTTNQNGCTAHSAEVCYATVKMANNNEFVCAGGSAQLLANNIGDENFAWSPTFDLDNANIVNPQASPSGSVTYTVTVQVLTCTASDTVRVDLVTSLDANAGNNDTICEGQQLVLQGSGGGLYAWSSNPFLSDTSIATPVTSNTVSQWYYLTVSSGSCVDMDSVYIGVNLLPAPNASVANDTICLGTTTNLSASGGVSYNWIPADGLSATTIANPIAQPTVSTWYFVSVTNNSGCSNIDSVFVYVRSCVGIENEELLGLSMNLYPNPTSGMVNIELSNVDSYQLYIFDLNGKQVYSELNNNRLVGKQIKTIDLSNSPKGIYMIEIMSKDQLLVKKLIVQ